MGQKESMTLQMEPDLREQAAALFEALGLDLDTATGIFYRQALRCHGLPFASTTSQTPFPLRQWRRGNVFGTTPTPSAFPA